MKLHGQRHGIVTAAEHPHCIGNCHKGCQRSQQHSHRNTHYREGKCLQTNHLPNLFRCRSHSFQHSVKANILGNGNVHNIIDQQVAAEYDNQTDRTKQTGNENTVGHRFIQHIRSVVKVLPVLQLNLCI